MVPPIRCLALLIILAIPCAAEGPTRLTLDDITPAVARDAMESGTAFLLQTQNPDGSWGGATDGITTWGGGVWYAPESHRAWRVATTGLCFLTLLEIDPSPERLAAADRALDYLTANMPVKRINAADTMNCWPNIYGLQALAAAYGHARYAPRRDEILGAAKIVLAQLGYHQSLSGGWGYFEAKEPRTARPQWATSFTTGAAVIALLEAKQQGLPVDEAVLQRAIKAVQRCRLPNGAYTYSVRAIAHPWSIGSINRVKGSLSRIQTCNLALLMAGEEMPQERLRTGMDNFFHHHRFLEIALHKPIPHEAYYQNSGYFYMFGHYYAARVIQQLPQQDRNQYWPRLQFEIIKIQQRDGSMWDYDHHAYDRPYGTAFGVMALHRSLQDQQPTEPATSASVDQASENP